MSWRCVVFQAVLAGAWGALQLRAAAHDFVVLMTAALCGIKLINVVVLECAPMLLEHR